MFFNAPFLKSMNVIIRERLSFPFSKSFMIFLCHLSFLSFVFLQQNVKKHSFQPRRLISARLFLYNENHRSGRWFQKALAMSGKKGQRDGSSVPLFLDMF